MQQSIWTPRVTVAAIIERDGVFLFVEELGLQGPVLNQPAGHLEDAESLVDAVIREVREETCRDFTPQGIVGLYRWRISDAQCTYLRVCFHGSCSDPDPQRALDPAILRTCWLSREDLIATGRLRTPLVLACIDAFRAGHTYPLSLINDL